MGDRLDVAEFQMLDRDMSERIFLRADLVSEVNIEEDLPEFLQYLAWLRLRWSLLDFTPGALLALCRHASRLCDHQEWLSLSEVQLSAIMRMADSLARELEAEKVTDEHILLALEEQDYRLNYLVEQSDQESSMARSCCRPTVKRWARSTASPSSRWQVIPMTSVNRCD